MDMTGKDQNGSITVFLSLLMIFLLSLFAVSLESAHMAAVKGQISLKSNTAMETLFSNYERSLYEQYHLLFLDTRQNPESTLLDIMKESGSPAVLKEKGTNHLQFQVEKVEISQMVGLLDHNGEAFQTEVKQIAGSEMVSAFWNRISGKLEKLKRDQSSSGEINQMLEKDQIPEETDQDKQDELEASDEHRKVSEEEKRKAISIVSLIKTVKKWITEGFFSLIVDNSDEISTRVVDNSDMPSDRTPEKNEITGNILEHAVDCTVDAVTMNWYLSRYLNCYTDQGTYDLEYVIGNRKTDSENLKTVVNQLVLLRQILNLSYLAGDEAKKAEAELAATAVLSVMGIPAAGKVGEYFILAAWAYAEAVSDVRSLMRGGKIEFIKNQANWKLSLEQAVDYSNWVGSQLETEAEETGMEYKEYLMILMFFRSHQRNMYRGLDMIQWNLMQTDPAFRIANCIYGMKADFYLHADPIFLSGSVLSDTGKLACHLEHQEYYAYE